MSASESEKTHQLKGFILAVIIFGVMLAAFYVKQSYDAGEEKKKPLITNTAAPVLAATPAPPPAKVEISKDEELAQKIALLETELEAQKRLFAEKFASLEETNKGLIKRVGGVETLQASMLGYIEEQFASLTQEQKENYAQFRKDFAPMVQNMKGMAQFIAELKRAQQNKEGVEIARVTSPSLTEDAINEDERALEEVTTRPRSVSVARANNVVSRPTVTAKGNYRPYSSVTVAPTRANAVATVRPYPNVIAPPSKIRFEQWLWEKFTDSSGDYAKATTNFSTWNAAGKNLVVRAAVMDSEGKIWDIIQGLQIAPQKEGEFYREFVVLIPFREIPKNAKVALRFYDKNDLNTPIATSDWKFFKELQALKQNNPL